MRRRDGTSAPINKLRGFIEYERNPEPYRPPAERLGDYLEINATHEPLELKRQAARCMDCGTPFCQTHTGCPINNLIPEFNNLVFTEQWKEAYTNLASTNNFPEFTGRVCPAPCEGSCVAGLVDKAVTIKNMEYTIIDRAWAEGWVTPQPPRIRSGKKVAVIGSGPAGLAAADELNKKYGHFVTVLERAAKPGGLLTYGIPNMKLDKETVERRLKLMEAEGVEFVCGTDVGEESAELLLDYDAVVLATGSTVPNDLPIPGRQLNGIVFAMEFLTQNQQRLFASDDAKKSLLRSKCAPPAAMDPTATPQPRMPSRHRQPQPQPRLPALARAHPHVRGHLYPFPPHPRYDGSFIDAAGKNVIVIGGGDTGTDCIGTSLRHGCESLTNFELFPKPPEDRAENNPWPAWPRIYRTDYGHAEATHHFGDDPRAYSILSREFIGDASNNVKAVRTVEVRHLPVPSAHTRRPFTRPHLNTRRLLGALVFWSG